MFCIYCGAQISPSGPCPRCATLRRRSQARKVVLVAGAALVCGLGVWIFAPAVTRLGASPERAGRRATAAATGPSSISVVVPFVGCPSDGQVGLRDAPKATTRTVAIGTGEARKLAYYSSRYLGVLAPRGWYCFGTYGSNGETLYVSPQPVDTRLIAANGSGFTGSAVQISVEIGDTSGRFGVARAVARVFPAHVAFARRVIAEGIEPANSLS